MLHSHLFHWRRLSSYSYGINETILSLFKVIGIRPLASVQNSVSLKLMQGKTLNFVINLPDVENITKSLDSILTKVSIIKVLYSRVHA